jgi:hypothetical protein
MKILIDPALPLPVLQDRLKEARELLEADKQRGAFGALGTDEALIEALMKRIAELIPNDHFGKLY